MRRGILLAAGISLLVGALVAITAMALLRQPATVNGGGGMMGGTGTDDMMRAMPEPMVVWRPGSGAIADPAAAAAAALTAIRDRGWTWLAVDEVHIFSSFFEVETNDRGGLKGPELYVNRSSGDVGPEMGPNTSWDTQYGSGSCAQRLSQQTAAAIARTAVQRSFGGALALGDAEQHHGYWEFELKRNGTVVNQINVNECSRQTVAPQMWQPDMIGTYAPNG